MIPLEVSKIMKLTEKGKRTVVARGWREEGNEELFNEYSISHAKSESSRDLLYNYMHIFNIVHLKIVKRVNLCFVFFLS